MPLDGIVFRADVPITFHKLFVLTMTRRRVLASFVIQPHLADVIKCESSLIIINWSAVHSKIVNSSEANCLVIKTQFSTSSCFGCVVSRTVKTHQRQKLRKFNLQNRQRTNWLVRVESTKLKTSSLAECDKETRFHASALCRCFANVEKKTSAANKIWRSKRMFIQPFWLDLRPFCCWSSEFSWQRWLVTFRKRFES